MRTILKIFVAPFVVLLTIFWAAMVFVFSWAETILQFVSGIAMLLALVMFFGKQIPGGITFAAIGFLISPVGIPAIAEWLINKIDDLNGALKDFITT